MISKTWIKEILGTVDYRGKDNPEVRKIWVDKKYRLRIYCALAFSVLVIIGLQLTGVNFGGMNDVGQKSSVLKALVDGVNNEGLSYIGVSAAALGFSNVYENFVFILSAIFAYVHFSSNDPLSYGRLIKESVYADNKDFKILVKVFPELIFYRSEVPSNNIQKRCDTCETLDCENRLSLQDDSRNSRWNTVFGRLSPSVVNNLSKVTHKCRIVFFSRFVLFSAATYILWMYFIAQAIEALYGTFKVEVYVLLYIGFLYLMYYVIGVIHGSDEKGLSGVWFKFKHAFDDVLRTEGFSEVFRVSVCDYQSRGYEYSRIRKRFERKVFLNGMDIHRLVSVINYQNRMDSEVFFNKLRGHVEERNDADSIREKIEIILGALIAAGIGGNTIRSALFVPNDTNNLLTPIASVPFEDQEFISLGCVETRSVHLSANSSSVAVKAWKNRSVVSASGEEINYFHEGQRVYLKSMVSIPILVSNEVVDYFDSIGVLIPEVVAVLTIDSNVEMDFDKYNEDYISLITSKWVGEIRNLMLDDLKSSVS